MINILYFRPKIYWVIVNLIMVLLMVSIGGITRLTDSGLSMTEWSLISGAIPPLTANDWIETFNKYKVTPEFIYKNYDMTLLEFKKIFFWEYFHRIWGRLIGLTYLLPLIYFWITNKLSSTEKIFFLILLVLGATQAFMGWFMVKSGLTENPDVSHFRLSAHLLIAFIIYSMLLFYLWVKITLLRKDIDHTYRKPEKFNNLPIFLCIILVLFTIVTGAFVAGTKAGWAYNNFPLMGESLLPPVLLEKTSYSISYLLNDIGFIQFFHRILASTTLFFIIFTGLYLLRTKPSKQINMLSKFLLVAITLQYILGVIILKFYIPISLGVMHQFGSLVVISLLIMILGEKMSMGVQTNSQYTFKLIKNFYL
jgi:cytochrome c oxidase assembly protein subunit 15